MSEKTQGDALVGGVGQVGKAGMSIGAKTIATAMTGSREIGDAAAVATNAAVGRLSKEGQFLAGSTALFGGATAVKCVAVVGGVALAPAAATVAAGAFVAGLFGLAIAAVLDSCGSDG